MRWFLYALSGTAAVSVLVGCSALTEYLASPEGQESANQLASGASAAIANPVNPLAWWDIAIGGGAILAGAFGLKQGGRAVKAAGSAIKKHVLNPKETPATG